MPPVPQQEQAHQVCLLLTVPLGRGMERAKDPPLSQGSKRPGQKEGFTGKVPYLVELLLTKGSKCLALDPFPSLMLTLAPSLGAGLPPYGRRAFRSGDPVLKAVLGPARSGCGERCALLWVPLP